MDSFELDLTLGQLGLEVPDRCKTCQNLGGLVTKLFVAEGNKALIAISTEPEVLVAHTRAQLAEQVRQKYPGATDEQVATTVENSVKDYLGSEKHVDFLKQADILRDQEDAAIAANVTKIDELLAVCPPEGCSAN